MSDISNAVLIEVYVNTDFLRTKDFEKNEDITKGVKLEAVEINIITFREEIKVAFRKTPHKKNFNSEELKYYIINCKDEKLIETDADFKTAIDLMSETLQFRVIFQNIAAKVAMDEDSNVNNNMSAEDVKEDALTRWLSNYKLESIYGDLQSAGYDSYHLFANCNESDIIEICDRVQISHSMKLKLRNAITKYQYSLKISMEKLSISHSYESECAGEKIIKECEKIRRLGIVMKHCQILLNANAVSGDEYRDVESLGNPFANYNRKYFNLIDFQLLTNDFNHVRKNGGKHNDQYDEVLDHLISDFLGGVQCLLEICACNQRNNIEKEELNVSNMHLDLSEMANISVIDKIHVQLFHGIDIGYRYSNAEAREIANACAEPEKIKDETDVDVGFGQKASAIINDYFADCEESNINNTTTNANFNAVVDELSGNYDQLCTDIEVSAMQKISHPKIERANFRKSREHSKFVMVGNKIRNQRILISDNDDQKENLETDSSKDPIFYSPGVRFYYWAFYKNNPGYDNINNALYSHWYILPKYKHVIEEFEQEQPKLTIYKEKKKSQVLMTSSMVKEMGANADFSAQYRIRGGQLIAEVHVLCILMYCNWTKFCTTFSETYRRKDANESDEEFIERHSHFHYYGRFLRETVECYGTSMKDSEINVFFHGISVYMYFRRTFCRFCTPTSTTYCLSVAINFARKGLVLALRNDKLYAKYFDVCLFSDYSNENELLFIGGANMIPIESIRQMIHNQKAKNYEHFIVSITTMQQMFSARDPDFEILHKHKKILIGLIVQRLQLRNINNENIPVSEIKSYEILSERIPEYITQLFGHICDAMNDIHIAMKYFKNRRKIISDSEMESVSNNSSQKPETKENIIHINYSQYRTIFLMPESDYQLNCLLFCQLFPNLKKVELEGVMIDDNILNAMIDHFLIKADNMNKLIVSLDTESPLPAEECIVELKARLQNKWKVDNKLDRKKGILQKFECSKNK